MVIGDNARHIFENHHPLALDIQTPMMYFLSPTYQIGTLVVNLWIMTFISYSHKIFDT
jgi:hypothetical protein